jgi:hypothetical protein
MAFIDTGASASAFGGVNPGAPSGSGVANQGTSNPPGAPGSGGPGSGMSSRSWVLFYYAFIVGVLVITGVIFNGRGRG